MLLQLLLLLGARCAALLDLVPDCERGAYRPAPLELGAVRTTQGKTLAVMQVCGGSQSFNAVNQMRVLGR